MKKFISLLAMVLSVVIFVGCGSPAVPAKQDAVSPSPMAETKTDELVYAASFKPVSFSGENYLGASIYTDEGLYALSTEKVGDNTPEGVVPNYENEYAVYNSFIYFVGYDGSVKKLDNFVPLELAEAEEGQYNFRSNVYIATLLPCSDGKLIAIENLNSSWCSRPDLTWEDDSYWQYSKSSSEFYLRMLSSDGTVENSVRLPLGEDEWYNSVLIMPDGNLLLACDNRLKAVSLSGELLWEIELETYVNALLNGKDGIIYALLWGDNGMQLDTVDLEKHVLEEAMPIPNDAYNLFTGNGEYPFYYNSGSNLFGLREDGSKEKLFSWLNLDVSADMYEKVYITPEGNVRGLYSESEYEDDKFNYTYQIFEVKPIAVSELPKRQELTLAVLYNDYDVVNTVLKFNRSHNDIHITVQEYSENEDIADSGVTKLQTEIMAGNVPDLLLLNGLDASSMMSNGILEDLYPYLDNDQEMKREDFFQNVLSACEMNGKLAFISPSFRINTLIGASSIVGDKPGWTYDEVRAALQEMPDGCTVLSKSTTRSNILFNCLNLEGKNLIDIESGKCHLDSEAYIDLLKFAKSFPSEFDWETYDWQEDSDEKRIAAGEQMCMESSIYSLDSVVYSRVYFGDQPCTFIGYPNSQRNGSSIEFNSRFAMTTACKNKEVGWQFLRSMLQEKYQDRLYEFPILRSAYEKSLKDVTTVQYRKNSNGDFVLDENGEKIPEIRWGYSDGVHNFDFTHVPQEDAERVTALIESTSNYTLTLDDEIFNIIKSEAEGYFAGQKSAEEVARLTQSKVNIFINEKR